MDVLIYDTSGRLAYDTRELGAFEGSRWRANCYIIGRSVREDFPVSILPEHAKRIYELRNPEDLERPIRRKVNTESGEVEQQIRDVEHRIRGS